MLYRLAFIMGCLVCSTPGYALTAVCHNPTGRNLGIHGLMLGGGKPIDEPDRIARATFTVLWNTGEREATIVTQNSGGGTPMTERATVVLQTNEQLSLLVVLESAVWLYSVYPKPKMLIMSSHNNGMAMDVGGAVAKTFQARCDISE